MKRRRKKPVSTAPSCTITIRNWQGNRQIRLRGVPLQLDVRHHPIEVSTWDSYLPHVIPGPCEVTMTFGPGDPKMRISA